MKSSYAVIVRGKDGTLINRLNDFVSLKIIDTLNGTGSWSITSMTRAPCPFEAGTGIIVLRDNAYFYSGVLTEIQDEFDAHTRLYSWEARGKNDLEYLNRRICYVDPATGQTDEYAHYTDTDYLSEVVYTLINVNLGPSALTARQEPIIGSCSGQNVGESMSVSLRFQNLFDTVVAIVKSQVCNIRSVWDTSTNKVSYEVFQGVDRTDQIVFTEQLSNIVSSEYLATAPEGNFILAGGTGEMTERTFATAQNNDSISEWGRIEKFQDARNQSNVGPYAEETLQDKSENVTGYSAIASDEEHTPQYMRDYRLGDYVGMKVHGTYVTAQVQQVEISVSDDMETISPRCGTVAIGKFKSIFAQLSGLRQDVNELLGTEVA